MVLLLCLAFLARVQSCYSLEAGCYILSDEFHAACTLNFQSPLLIQMSVIISEERFQAVGLDHNSDLCDCTPPPPPQLHSPFFFPVTLPWRAWWKWLFNHAERSTNQRAQAEWFKGPFGAQLEGERKERVMRKKRETGWCWLLRGTGHVSSDTSGLISLIDWWNVWIDNVEDGLLKKWAF